MNLIYEKLVKFATCELDKSLKELTTLRIGGNAKYVVYPENLVSLSEVIRVLNENDIPYKLIGKGSNLLCGDSDYEGCIIKLDRFLNDFYFDDTTLVAQAGCSIIQLSYEAMKKGLSGLEFASGIPATLGGTLFMNAGAYKSSMQDVVSEVMVLKDGDYVWLSNEECEFAYRHSIFQKHSDWICVAARIQLKHGDIDAIRELMDERRERRMKSQPLDKPSAGSVFRNPEGKLAWKYIEDLGYRGKKIGGAKVSDKHVNFIINDGNATCEDFLALTNDIIKNVKIQFNEDLYMEVEKFNCD